MKFHRTKIQKQRKYLVHLFITESFMILRNTVFATAGRFLLPSDQREGRVETGWEGGRYFCPCCLGVGVEGRVYFGVIQTVNS